jgi:hypothetical protein
MDLQKIFHEALGEFLAREFALVWKNAHEQALCGRLARYMEVAKDKAGLDKYYVDVEYDRHGDLRKTMFNTSTGKPENIVCDLLLHSRGEQKKDNLIALEMKKATGKAREKQTDRERLQALTSPNPEGDQPQHVWDYNIGYYLEVDVKAASVLIQEYRVGRLTHSWTAKFVPPERSPSDAIPFAKNESRARRSTVTK